MKSKVFFKTVFLIYSIGTIFCSVLKAQSDPVVIYNTHGSNNKADWTIVKGIPDNLDPEQTVIENGLIRLTYPCGLGRKVNDPKKYDQKAGNLVYLKIKDEYVLAQNIDFGDWIYVGESVVTEPTGFKIIKNSDDIAQFEMSFDNHLFKGGSVFKYDPASGNPFKKSVTLYRGHYGYVVHIDIERDIPGEREAGFGLASNPTFYYCTDNGHMRPDMTTIYIYPRQVDEMKNYWSAGITPENSFYRFISVRPKYPHAIRSGQWSPGQIGAFYRWAYQGLDYEAYIAVVPYDADKANEISVVDNMVKVEVPVDGQYSIFGQKEDGLYEPVIKGIWLRKGKNDIKLGKSISLKNPIIAPIANGVDFPEDISRIYQYLYN